MAVEWKKPNPCLRSSTIRRLLNSSIENIKYNKSSHQKSTSASVHLLNVKINFGLA